MGASLAGHVIDGRYALHGLAGEGGMGAVYRGTDQETGGSIALKVIRPDYLGSIERFEREIDLLASLDHPGIVRHVGHGRTPDGAPFLVMEWMEGEDLAARIARGPLSTVDAVALVSRAAHALAEVHARGIVHRDVKPSNFFLRDGAPGRPVLLDFGVARRAGTHTTLTRTGAVVGTPTYMSPEQVRGAREIGPASDLFALGSVLFECLAGRPPFLGDHAMAVLAKVVLEDPPPVRSLAPGVPAHVAELLAAMLAKRPEDRPADAIEVARRLASAAAASATVTSAPGSTAVLTSRERRLVAVVLAREPTGEDDRTVSAETAEAEHAALTHEIDTLGGALSPIGAGNLVVTVPRGDSAVDQASAAGRCARAIARRHPGATIAIAMGWAELDPLPVGEVIDRAASLLDRGAGAIHVDDVSAGLLELRFDVGGDGDRRVLLEERSSEEPPRTLLGRPTPCVGRDRELGVLLGLLGEVIGDEVARVAHVTAPPGTGKSRLRHELGVRIAGAHPGAEVLLARADVLFSNASLHIAGEIVRHAAGIGPGDDASAARARLAARAAAVTRRDRDEAAALLGEIAGIPFDGAASARVASARRDRRVIGELMLAAWVDWLATELDARPLVLVVEDLHWADPASVRYLDVALRELHDRPLFVLALSRPEVAARFPALWKDRAVQEIALPPLTARAAERLVRGVLHELAPADVERVVRQSEGNPLYIEEMVRAAASGGLREMPLSVVAMMQSRLESFDPGVRRVIRAASALGESFETGDLVALAGEEGEARTALDLLVAREVLSRRGPGGEEHAFRHALVREAAYSMFTPEDRARAHGLAAARLAERAVDPGVIAEHHDLAGDRAAAASWHVRAAQAALRKNDFETAVARADAALARSEHAPIVAAALAARGKAFLCLGRHAEAERDLLAAVDGTTERARRIEILEDLCMVSSYRQDAVIMRSAGARAIEEARAEGREDLSLIHI